MYVLSVKIKTTLHHLSMYMLVFKETQKNCARLCNLQTLELSCDMQKHVLRNGVTLWVQNQALWTELGLVTQNQ